MVKLKSIVLLLLLPVNLFLVVIKYYTIGGIGSRKYDGKNLLALLKLTVYRTALLLGPVDSWLLNILSVDFLLKIVKFQHEKTTSILHKFGEKYDSDSYWLVQQPDIKPEDPIVIYLHGGGFFLQVQKEQIESILAIYRLLDPKIQRKTSILMLDYKLASDGYPFPTQLEQLHSTYTSLVKDGHTNITVLGDSAGGNLSVGYLDYLKHNDHVIPPANLVMISPWLKLEPEKDANTPGKSLFDSKLYDMISYNTFTDPAGLLAIIGDSPLQSLRFSPGSKKPYDVNDWKNCPTLSNPKSSVFVLVGEDEGLRDDILEWCHYALDVPFYKLVKYGYSHENFVKHHHEFSKQDGLSASVHVFVEPWGIHDSCVFFENHLLAKLEKNSKLTLDDIDDVEFYGIKKITNFLNDTL